MKFVMHRWIALFALSVCLAACGVPRDEYMLSSFQQHEACFARMATAILSARDVSTTVVSWQSPFQPYVAVKSTDKRFREDTAVWYDCMWAANVSRVSTETKRGIINTGTYRTSTIAVQHEDEPLVFFAVAEGLASGGREKGVVFAPSDDLGGVGDIVPSLNDPPQTLEPQNYAFRRIKPQWYLYYFYYK